MNNKETLQSYNTALGENNGDLETILTTINDLPDSGSSEDLSDELDTYDSELNRQETSIANIVDLLATKGVGSGVGGDDMIKYSTEEQVIGEWIDGRPLYSRTFIAGVLPNTDTLDVPYDIENLDKFIDIRGIAYNGEFALLLPCSHQTDNSCINLYAWYAGNKICVQTFSDRSSYTENYIIAQYIKKATS